MFLRKQSGNSLANWWSVCFKMFFSNGFICGVASTGSATVYENYFYAQPPSMKIIFMLFCFIFWSVKVLFFHYFFKYAKLAKFIRYEALWELSFKQTFFYHKVHGEQVKWWRFWVLWGTSEMFWKGHEFSVGRCRKTFSLMKRFFTTLRFVQNDMVLFFTCD